MPQIQQQQQNMTSFGAYGLRKDTERMLLKEFKYTLPEITIGS